jgi:uncharacterized damage-inducible protein DinB
MTYGGNELAAAFRTVRKNTIQIAQDIPEDKYGFKAAPEVRSVAQMLAHIGAATIFPVRMHGGAGKIDNMQQLDFQQFMQQMAAAENQPRAKAELIAFLKDEGEKFAAFLETLPDSVLAERVTMMPGADPASRTRFDMLLSAKEHEMHHRAQLMLLERLLGIVPHLTRQMEERWARLQAQPTR